MDRLSAWWFGLSSALRLTLAYAAIIAILGFIYSIVLYQFADGQIVDGLRRQYFDLYRIGGGVNGTAVQIVGPAPDSDDIMTAISPLVSAARHALVLRLAYFNLAIVFIGGAVSYVLAKRTMRPIELALEAQTRFTADASHELRTPLAVMRTEIEIARADPELTKDQAVELLDSNLEEVSKLHALADSLLRLARSNQQPIQLAPTSTTEVATEAIDRVAARAKFAQVAVVNDVAAAKVMADLPSLVELIVILLDNAIKYSPSGSVVRLSSVRHRGGVSLSVTDQGRGISAEDQSHIFDRFYRADASRTTSDVEGHGLGLSIARQIAELHGATITVQSSLEQGSSFSIRLNTH